MWNEVVFKSLIISDLRMMKNFLGGSEIFWKFFWTVFQKSKMGKF